MDRPMIAPMSLARVLCVSLPALLTAPMMAQAVGDWRPVPSVTTPPARVGFALAELPLGDMLLFGGDASNPSATEWRWDGIDWHPYTATSVPRRDNPALGKVGNGGLILFGGTSGGSFLTDTWRSFDGVSWIQETSGAQPGILTDTSMAFDPVSLRMVMIGQTLQGLYATWFYTKGVAWSAGPTFAAAAARIVTDTVRGEVLLFEGGFPSVSVSCLEDSSWQALGVSQQGLALGEVTFDERRGRVVLIQPFDSQETVEWDGLSFGVTMSPAGQFVPPVATAMSYHARRSEAVLVANYGNGIETWRHSADASPGAISFGPGCGGPSPVLRLAPGASPEPGISHRIEGSHASVGVTLSVLGFSHTVASGVSLPLVIPISPAGCELLVDPAVVTVLGTSTQTAQLIAIPNSAALLAERYNAQLLLIDASGVAGASNGLEVQIGLPLLERELIESFASTSNRDDTASGDLWMNGSVSSTMIGGDGRHGSFSVDLGQQLGGGVVLFDTDSTVIPASNTLTNQEEVVTDGRFYFTDFIVPAGATVRFVGSVSAQIFVRGQTSVMGTVSVDAAAMPFAVATAGSAIGQNVTTFAALASINGQPGGSSGPGGARGGNGANRGNNLGPIIVGGVALTDGQPGESVQVSAGHAYLSATDETGGRGSPITPVTGIWGTPTPTVGGIIYCAYFSPGGSGGGYQSVGGVAAQPVYTGVGLGSIAAGGIALPGLDFNLQPFPPSPGYSSLEHYSVGGSGGGGGGTHGYGIIAIVNPFIKFIAGHGGSGGGGVLVIRSGSGLQVSGELSSRGGDAPWITGEMLGISSPGGGGSGGSIVLQSATNTTVSGAIDTRGGIGGRVGLIANPLQSMDGQAGNGSTGNFRLEAASILMTGVAVPPYNFAVQGGQMNDTDALTGSRSKWLLPASLGLPLYVRYELLVDIGGLPVLYSDDPDVSPLAANDPNGAVLVRFQGARVDAITGTAQAGTEGPWRTAVGGGVGSLNADRAEAVRFDMVMNKSAGAVQVLEMRIVWR